MLRKIVFGLCFLAASQVKAVDYDWQAGVLERIYPLSNGDFVVTFKGGSPNCTNGSNPKYHYVRNGVAGVTADGVKAMLGVSLAAAMSGKAITVSFDKDSSTCDVRRLFVEF
jgi:hypothetical protein